MKSYIVNYTINLIKLRYNGVLFSKYNWEEIHFEDKIDFENYLKLKSNQEVYFYSRLLVDKIIKSISKLEYKRRFVFLFIILNPKNYSEIFLLNFIDSINFSNYIWRCKIKIKKEIERSGFKIGDIYYYNYIDFSCLFENYYLLYNVYRGKINIKDLSSLELKQFKFELEKLTKKIGDFYYV